jgi:hypothetical protein
VGVPKVLDRPPVAAGPDPDVATPTSPAPARALLAATLAAAVALGAAAYVSIGIAPFTLDDPLIHVRVAQQISQGNYGLNPGVTASPSSSAIWPFLLAPLGGTALITWVPLLITTACALVSVRLIYALLRRTWSALDPSGWTTAAVAGTIALGTGVVALVFMGLEHALQVSVTLAVLLGLARSLDDDGPPAWLWAAIAIGPGVRYEGVMVSTAAVVALLLLGHRRRPLQALAGAFAGIVAFSAFLVAIGRSPIPSSILAKASTMGGGTSADGVASQALDNWYAAFASSYPSLVGLALLVVVGALALAVRRETDVRRELAVLGTSAAVLAGHLTLFGHDAYWRYEAYAMVAAVTSIAFALPTLAGPLSTHLGRRAVQAPLGLGATAIVLIGFGPGTAGVITIALAAALLLVPVLVLALRDPGRSDLVVVTVLVTLAIAAPLVVRTFHIGSDARAIYQQQHQTQRFAQLLDEPIAANDIGWISVDADHQVLDLWGLASEEAREARAEAAPGWMDRLLVDEGVEVAVIYDEWFEDEVPERWVLVARLTSDLQGMTAKRTVAIYGRDAAAADRAAAALDQLEPTLPTGVTVERG